MGPKINQRAFKVVFRKVLALYSKNKIYKLSKIMTFKTQVLTLKNTKVTKAWAIFQSKKMKKYVCSWGYTVSEQHTSW